MSFCHTPKIFEGEKHVKRTTVKVRIYLHLSTVSTHLKILSCVKKTRQIKELKCLDVVVFFKDGWVFYFMLSDWEFQVIPIMFQCLWKLMKITWPYVTSMNPYLAPKFSILHMEKVRSIMISAYFFVRFKTVKYFLLSYLFTYNFNILLTINCLT